METGLEPASIIQVEQRRLPAYLKAKTEIIWAIEKENESRRAPPRELKGLMGGLLERRILSKSDRRSEINQKVGWMKINESPHDVNRRSRVIELERLNLILKL